MNLTNKERGRLDRLKDRCHVLQARLDANTAGKQDWEQELSALSWAVAKIEAESVPPEALRNGPIKLPVSLGQEPEGEPDAETMIIIRDASGVALDPEEIVAALNATPLDIPAIIRGSTWRTPELRESAATLVRIIMKEGA